MIYSVDMAQSGPLTRALTTNSTAQSWAATDVLTAAPTADGCWDAGLGANLAPTAIILLPFCSGNPGQQFSLRVIGWRRTLEENVNKVCWVFYPLCEILCQAGAVSGPVPEFVPSERYLKPEELFCDTLTLSAGALGPVADSKAEIVAFGGGPAYAVVDLRGCQKWQLDFQQVDNVQMNALWALV